MVINDDIFTLVRIDDEGNVSSRYYLKPQNKGITLNAMSHHPTSTKEASITQQPQFRQDLRRKNTLWV